MTTEVTRIDDSYIDDEIENGDSLWIDVDEYRRRLQKTIGTQFGKAVNYNRLNQKEKWLFDALVKERLKARILNLAIDELQETVSELKMMKSYVKKEAARKP